MRKSRFSEEQIVQVSSDRNGKPVKFSCSGKNPSHPFAYDLDTGEGSVGVLPRTGVASLVQCPKSSVVSDTAMRTRRSCLLRRLLLLLPGFYPFPP